MNRQSQCVTVWCHMRQFGSIDPRTASRKYDIDRLAARIFDLRAKVGRRKIRSERVRTRKGKRFSRYSLQ